LVVVTSTRMCLFGSAASHAAELAGTMQAYLLKRGEFTWWRRYVTLTEDAISYYRSSSPADSFSPLNSIPLELVRDVYRVRNTSGRGEQHVFRVEMEHSPLVKSNKMELFACRS